MVYRELDIDYSLIDDKEFEELCFDLLLKLGYSNMKWRLGSGDNGRDIEASFYPKNPLIEYEEKWFFECKYYSKGVPPEKLFSKIAWADAENPKHYVFITSSYITNNGLTWLEKMKERKNYSIHYIQGKNLKSLISNYPELVIKYFATKDMKLVRELKRNWLIHNLLPDENHIVHLTNSKNYKNMNKSDKAFLLFNHRRNQNAIEEWHCYNYYFSIDNLVKALDDEAKICKTPLILEKKLRLDIEHNVQYMYDLETPFSYELYGTVLIDGKEGLYLYGVDHKLNGIELVVFKNSNYKTEVRKFPSGGESILKSIKNYIYAKQ